MKFLSMLFCLCFSSGIARQGFGPTDQEWGYVTVRDGAHMFWWLHYTTATTQPTEKPLIIWLQGGPGGSSTEYGNFEELGPLDLDLKPRNYTWVQYANVMFVDNPVGTGFSYVDENQYATTNQQIAADFVALLQSFYNDFPEFETVPLYIFSESYGGKMTAEIALNLDQAIKNGQIKSNFKGVGLGDSWISPIDSCLTWAPYLYSQGFLDTQQYEKLSSEVFDLVQLVDQEKWAAATDAWENLEGFVSTYTGGVDFYNILTVRSNEQILTHNLVQPAAVLTSDENIMNTLVGPALNLTQKWGLQSGQVFTALAEDFMKPVTEVVERLLNETDITVAVYNGQLDLIVDTPGTIEWVDRLRFEEKASWTSAMKEPFTVNGVYEGFEKTAGNLQFYWVLRAGHMVPKDNSNGMLHILQKVTENFKV